jgi:WhiB family transcriptional regulator, redox-sensing transcriptional regulator
VSRDYNSIATFEDLILASNDFGGLDEGDATPRVTHEATPFVSATSVIPPELAWQLDGLCSQADPEAWFPAEHVNAKPAKAVCRRCPVMDACAAYAIPRSELAGVWGGLSERERLSLRTARAVAA